MSDTERSSRKRVQKLKGSVCLPAGLQLVGHCIRPEENRTLLEVLCEST